MHCTHRGCITRAAQCTPPKQLQKDPKETPTKKKGVGGRVVEIGVKVSEELIYCTTAAKLYSHPAANINKYEFSSQNLCQEEIQEA